MKENIKNRVFKNIITTSIGAIILLVGLFMAYERAQCFRDNSFVCDHTWFDTVKTIFGGVWLILLKDTAITEGLFLGMFSKK